MRRKDKEKKRMNKNPFATTVTTTKKDPSVRWLPSTFIPGEHDVVCGRGKAPTEHVGNKRFKVIISDYYDRYITASTKFAKSLLVNEIVTKIRMSCASTTGGGFVKYQQPKSAKVNVENFNTKEGRGYWYEIGNQLARKKVTQELRNLMLSKSLRNNNIGPSSSSLREVTSPNGHCDSNESSKNNDNPYIPPPQKRQRKTAISQAQLMNEKEDSTIEEKVALAMDLIKQANDEVMKTACILKSNSSSSSSILPNANISQNYPFSVEGAIATASDKSFGNSKKNEDDEVLIKIEIERLQDKFYKAFSEQDIATMKSIWSTTCKDTRCIHPGQKSSDGYNSVIRSWNLVFKEISREVPSFTVKPTRSRVELHGRTAVCTCIEEFRERTDTADNNKWADTEHNQDFECLNIYRREDDYDDIGDNSLINVFNNNGSSNGKWKMILHMATDIKTNNNIDNSPHDDEEEDDISIDSISLFQFFDTENAL